MRHLSMMFGLSVFARHELRAFYAQAIQKLPADIPPDRSPEPKLEFAPPKRGRLPDRRHLRLIHSRPGRPQSTHGPRRSSGLPRPSRFGTTKA